MPADVCGAAVHTSGVGVIQSPLPLAPTVSESFDPSNVLVDGASQMTLTFSNPNQNGDITGVQLNDAFPPGMKNADQAPLVCDTCGFTEDVAPGASVANLSDGTIPAGDTCSIVINVVGTSPVDVVNDTGPITSTNAPDGTDASATLAVGLTAPSVTTSFAASSVSVGGTSQLTFELGNPNASDDITNVAFTDDYPTPLHMMNAGADVVVRNTCGGNLDAMSAGGSVALSGGTIPAGESCSVAINVVGTIIGAVDNHSGAVTSDNAQAGADASATLTVTHFPLMAAPDVSLQFSPDTIGIGGTSKMTITLTNPNLPPGVSRDMTGIQINDAYLAGITNAIANPVDSDTCGFTEDVPSDGTHADFANGLLSPGATCSVVINVVGTATTANDTGPIPSGNAATGIAANGTLTIDPDAPIVSCVLPTQIDDVGTTVSLDLSKLFAAAPGESLTFSGANLPSSLSIMGSLLTGTLDTAGTVASTLTATNAIPGGAHADETVNFVVLPANETLQRDGFDGTPCP